MKNLLLAILISLCTAVSFAAESASIRFDPGQALIAPGHRSVTYADLPLVTISDELALPATDLLVHLPRRADRAEIAFEADSSTFFTLPLESLKRTATSTDNRYDALGARSELGRSAVEFLGEEWINGERYVRLLVFPVSIDAGGNLIFHERVSLRLNGVVIESTDLIASHELLTNYRDRAATISLDGAANYSIVTAARFVPAIERLAQYRRQTGYLVEIMTTENIEAQYGGVDPAEQLRAYLHDFHGRGGRYVLLAGDETVVPNRLVYQYNITGTPSPELLQPSDLYFADLTGDWDADHDGIWGERTNDSPDLVEELYVGRLPLADSAQFEIYTDNLIRYETNPGNGDRSWLTRALFYSSDQMRDYQTGGQHAALAASVAGTFQIDTTTAVEQASGDDPSPDNLVAAQLDGAVTDAYGIVNIIAHGRSDGFVVRSSGYNEWPKSLLLISDETGDQGCVDSLHFDGKPSFYISLACDNGGYDLGPVGAERRTIVQTLLGTRDGAIGFVGNTRWGWVSSSYLLHRAFLDSLVAHPEQPAIASMYQARKVYPYYRDLIYGLNYFGDPALRVYVNQPSPIDIVVTDEGNYRSVTLTVGASPLVGAQVVVNDTDHQMVITGSTDAEGRLMLGDLPISRLFTLTAVRAGCLTLQVALGPSIITGIDDDLPGLPAQFALEQNYPNPFNPATSISYALPKATEVRLSIFNILGQTVARPIDQLQPAGDYTVTWDAADNASGVYFYRLETADYVSVRKMLLVR
jgi:hypothetical protein